MANSLNVREGLRKILHRRGKTMTKPILDRTQLLLHNPYLIDNRIGGFRPSGQPRKDTFHRRTISTDLYSSKKPPHGKPNVSFLQPVPPDASSKLAFGSTRNKLNKTQFVSRRTENGSLRGSSGQSPPARTVKLGHTKTTPATAVLSPAFTRRKFVELGRGGADLSSSFSAGTRGVRRKGTRTPAGVKEISVPRNKTFDFSAERIHIGKGGLRQPSEIQLCRSYELAEDVCYDRANKIDREKHFCQRRSTNRRYRASQMR